MKSTDTNNISDQNTANMERRRVMKKALYNSPKLLLLGTMVPIGPAAAGASDILGFPPDPPSDKYQSEQSKFENRSFD